MTSKQSTWTGMLPVDDTSLYVTDTGDSTARPCSISPSWLPNHSEILRNDSPAVAKKPYASLSAAATRSADLVSRGGLRPHYSVLLSTGTQRR